MRHEGDINTDSGGFELSILFPGANAVFGDPNRQDWYCMDELVRDRNRGVCVRVWVAGWDSVGGGGGAGGGTGSGMSGLEHILVYSGLIIFSV